MRAHGHAATSRGASEHGAGHDWFFRTTRVRQQEEERKRGKRKRWLTAGVHMAVNKERGRWELGRLAAVGRKAQRAGWLGWSSELSKRGKGPKLVYGFSIFLWP
jgi:hypothetical protein